MCDCYYHPCEVGGKECAVNWHIGDFDYDREEFRIWCRRHMDQAPDTATVFRYRNHKPICAALGPEVSDPDGDMLPNQGCFIERVNLGEMRAKRLAHAGGHQ